MLKTFEYKRPQSLNEAVAVIDRLGESAAVVAGGTCLMVDIRSKKINDKTLVDLVNIGGTDAALLREISVCKDGNIRIGALVTIADIAKSPIIYENARALYMAACVFADKTTRNTATIGGNVAYASPAGDAIPPLIAHDAAVCLLSVLGERKVNIEEFYTGFRTTDRRPNEIITHFLLKSRKSGFVKLGLRNSMAISVASAAAAAELNEDGSLKTVRIALGSVAPTTIRAISAEDVLIGKKWGKEAVEIMSTAIQSDINPIDDIRATAQYRRDVAPVCVKRALNAALELDCRGV